MLPRPTIPIDEILRRVRSAEELFCLLDYDGTLSPIAPTPDEAQPVPGIREVLVDLAAAPATRVAIISGRTVESVRGFLDVPGACYVGIHGIELRRPDGTRETAQGLALVRSMLPEIKRQLAEALLPIPGILIEDKGLALACHYRLAGEDGGRVPEVVRRIVSAYQRRGLAIEVLSGHAVSEIRPAHLSKGTAVSALLAGSRPTALPLCIGDDHADAEAFAVLPPGAIAIHVGPSAPPPSVQGCLADPYEVHSFLCAVLQQRTDLSREVG